MNIQEIQKIYAEISKSLSENHLFDFFESTQKLIEEHKLTVLLETHRELKEVYINILKYSFSKVKDPDRDKILQKLIQKCYELADSIKIMLLDTQKHFATVNILQELKFEFQDKSTELEKEIISGQESSINLFFKKIWLSPKLEENSIRLLNQIFAKNETSLQYKSLLISALTISNLRCFDKNKLDLLINYYQQIEGTPKHRALTGIVLNIYAHDKRIEVYPELLNKLNELKKEAEFSKFLSFIILQLIRSKETEKISQKLQEEILPEVAKFKPKIEDKLKLDDILNDLSSEDKNPDWEGVFEDAPELLGKLEQFSKIHHLQIWF